MDSIHLQFAHLQDFRARAALIRRLASHPELRALASMTYRSGVVPEKLLQGQLGALEDLGQRGTLHLAGVVGHGEADRTVSRMGEEVVATLDVVKEVSATRSVMGRRSLAPRSRGIASPRFRSTLRYPRTASLTRARASERVSPSVITPGRMGTVTLYPPSTAGSKKAV